MHDQDTPRPRSLDIRTPCPKAWEDLVGDDRRRFCEACSLHVHNGAQMTRAEAEALVADSASRVCMRLEYDGNGRPLFRDPASERARPIRRWARWMLTAAAGVMAACTDAARSATPSGGPDAPEPGSHVSTRLGRPTTVELLGDVAVAEPPAPVEVMGEVSAAPEPDAPVDPAPPAPREPK